MASLFLRMGATRSAPEQLLGEFAIGAHIIPGCYYIPDFFTPSLEAAAMHLIDNGFPKSKWIKACGRSILNLGGNPSESQVSDQLPGFVQNIVDAMVEQEVFSPDMAPNHCLVNDYRGGAGILPHQDSPMYHPRVATVSLRGPAIINLHATEDGFTPGALKAQVVLQPRALFLLTDPSYSSCVHGIEATTVDEVGEAVINAGPAGVSVGDKIPRGDRRVSMVFVRKVGRQEGTSRSGSDV